MTSEIDPSRLSEESMTRLMKSLNNLSTEQKRSFIILFIAYYSNLPCILQGPNGVGKSHLVKLLAKL